MPVSNGSPRSSDILIEADSVGGEDLWDKVAAALNQDRPVWIFSPLLSHVSGEIGRVYRDKKWVVIEDQSLARRDQLFRARDIVLSSLALAIFSPLFIVLAVLIKLTSPGPVFYETTVVGKNGRRFVWRKFRSMRVMPEAQDIEERKSIWRAYVEGRSNTGQTDAECGTNKVIDPSRVTPIGRVIRKHSIDELPQLWNVLKGQMSLVGPRPCLPYEAEYYTEWRSRRFDVLPGLTGVFQVFGRGRASLDEIAAMDVYYTLQRSFRFDLYLMLKTIGMVITGNGAA
jgi:lipopolysaccharide/colanic/teichoic acid biosynthesis glycosyltransferase